MATLTGRVAMLTGAGGERGFGRAIARRLAAEGADLVLTDVAPTGLSAVAAKPATGWGGLEAVAAEVTQQGRRALTALMDVRSAAQIDAVVARAGETFGKIDILVNNAGAPWGRDRAPVVELDEEAWDTVLDTNLKGTFLTARAVARAMLERRVRGRIVNMASQWGKRGGAQRAAYCASKFGVIGLTQALALELAAAGITVNAVCPGAADTDRLDHLGRTPEGGYDAALRAQRIAEQGRAIPVGRLATADDVVAVVAFLVSDAADYLTGQAINVTGGAVMH
jgi:3-oxoacyl-[acyl-carrier protein] reductase/meso-butanediol dehydrogenase/(S,S)-butanediol dehydrogenase/diacetyl reductase